MHCLMKKALIVFAKQPVPGQVKTRLTSLLSAAEAALLYQAFLEDALAQYRTLDVAVRLYLSSPPGPERPAYVPEGVTVKAQQGPDLGTRMKMALVDAFAAGYEQLVIIGTDHPTLPTTFIEQAFEALTERLSICIGPSDDGGYYLLGMNDLYSQLFDDMLYSHPEVFGETVQRASGTRAKLTILPTWYDVDTPEALQRLVADLEAMQQGAERTRAVVADLQKAYPELKADLVIP